MKNKRNGNHVDKYNWALPIPEFWGALCNVKQIDVNVNVSLLDDSVFVSLLSFMPLCYFDRPFAFLIPKFFAVVSYFLQHWFS